MFVGGGGEVMVDADAFRTDPSEHTVVLERDGEVVLIAPMDRVQYVAKV